jgi:transposase
MRLNERMAKLEMIKEHFHKIFECTDEMVAKEMLVNVYDWCVQINAVHIAKWVMSIIDDQRLWNYFRCKVTTGISEGINRAIKGLKWQAYGYKDMFYFALKIMQKVGYLNSKYSWATV